MRKRMCMLVATSLLATGGLAACSSGETPGGTTKTPKIGVILPDSASSARWETADRQYLEAAFTLPASNSTFRTPRTARPRSRPSPTR